MEALEGRSVGKEDRALRERRSIAAELVSSAWTPITGEMYATYAAI